MVPFVASTVRYCRSLKIQIEQVRIDRAEWPCFNFSCSYQSATQVATFSERGRGYNL